MCIKRPWSGGLFDFLDRGGERASNYRHDGDSNTGLAGDHFESDFSRCDIRNQFRTDVVMKVVIDWSIGLVLTSARIILRRLPNHGPSVPLGVQGRESTVVDGGLSEPPKVTVTFESEVASVAKLVVAYRLHGVPANGRAPLHAPQDSGPRFGPDEAANLQVMMPVLIKHGLLHRWPE